MENKKYQICTRCIMDTSDPAIIFDENGVCDFCNNYDNKILPNWNPVDFNHPDLQKIADKIKKDGKGKEYDCVIGMSGGADSSYLSYIAKVKLGLRPLILTVDTGWNLNVANENVLKIIEKLDLDLETVVVNWEEMKDLQLSFLKSQVPYQDLPQDHVIFAGLYNYAAKNGIKYVLTGANHSTEGLKPPQEWTYINDIKFIKGVHKKFGTKKLKTFPMCGMFKYKIFYRFFKGMKVVHFLNMIDYKKDSAVSVLEKEFGWKMYENKHYENIFTRFYEGYWLTKKFGYDKRICYLSNLIITGQMNRNEALDQIQKQPYDEKLAKSDMEYIADKLDITVQEFKEYMSGEKKTFRDYKNNYWIIKLAIKLAMLIGFEKRNFR
jgi:N-acetyl sugar amidotransferase